MKVIIRIAIVSMIITVLAGCTTSQRAIFLDMPIDAGPDEIPVDIEFYEEKYGENDAVYLYFNLAIEHSGNRAATWVYSRVGTGKYILFNPDLERMTTFQMAFIPDNLYVRVTTPDQQVQSYDKTDLRKGMNSDGGENYTIVFQDVTRGTVVEYGWDYANEIYYPSQLEYNFDLRLPYPCERTTLTYAYPEWWKLDFKDTGLDNEVPIAISTDTEIKKTTITYEQTDVPAIEEEEYAPYFREVAEYAQFRVTELVMGSMNYEAPESWEEFGRKFLDAVLGKADGDADKVSSVTSEVIGEASDESEKVARILTYVQEEIEAGEGRDGDYGKIFKKKSGNIIDITALTCAMLNQAGFDARFMLVHSAADGYFDPTYVEGSEIRYPAVRVSISGEMRVLIPYLKNLPQNHIPQIMQNQTALVFGLNSVGDSKDATRLGKAELWALPDGNPLDDTSSHQYELEILPNGDVEALETITAHGVFAYRTRRNLEDLLEEEQEELIEKMVAVAEAEVDLKSFEIENKSEFEKPLVITAKYIIRNMVTVTPEEAVFHTGGLFSPLTGVKISVDASKRQNPIRIYNDEQHTKDITIKLPEGWSLLTKLPEVEVENDIGSLYGSATAEAGVVNVRQKLHLNKVNVAADRNRDFLELVIGNSAFSVPALVFGVNN